MPVMFVEPGETVDVRQIEKIESALQASLPADYRKFLLTNGGSVPEPNELPDTPDVGVSLFFTVGDLLANKSDYSDRIPDGFLPIADLEGGNLLCISLNSKDFGTLYYWDHESEADEGETPGHENVEKISDTFSTFWNALRRLELEEDDDDDDSEVWVEPGFLKKE